MPLTIFVQRTTHSLSNHLLAKPLWSYLQRLLLSRQVDPFSVGDGAGSSSVFPIIFGYIALHEDEMLPSLSLDSCPWFAGSLGFGPPLSPPFSAASAPSFAGDTVCVVCSMSLGHGPSISGPPGVITALLLAPDSLCHRCWDISALMRMSASATTCKCFVHHPIFKN